MRKASMAILLLTIALAQIQARASAQASQPLQITAVEFAYPQPDMRYYHLRVSLFAAQNVALSKAVVNGEESNIISLLGAHGQPRVPNMAAATKAVLEVAVAWVGDATYSLKLVGSDDKGQALESSWSGKAPPGGYWNPAWHHYKPVLVEEDWGVERVGEPVEVTVGFPASEIDDPQAEVRVVEVSPTGQHKEVPSQVYDIRSSPASSQFSPPSLSCTIAFLADVPANGKKVYLIFHGNKDATPPNYPSDFKVSGDEPGITVENDWYRMALSPQHGQFLALSPKAMPGTRWTFYQGAIHWNPDVFPVDRKWSHVIEWQKPPHLTEVRGPILVRTKRFGPLPWTPEVSASVTYRFYAHNPWILVDSLLDFQQDLSVLAVRSGEIVFDQGTFSHGAWRGRDGKVGTVQMLRKMDMPEARVKSIREVLEGDVPWVCMFSPGQPWGVGGINISNFSGCFGEGAVAAEPSAVYFCNTGSTFMYWGRSTIYPYLSPISHAAVVVPKGSIFAERAACLPFRLGDSEEGRFAQLDALHYQLTHPLRVDPIGWPPVGF